MKRFFSILTLVAITFAFISCGGDDGPTPPPDMPKTINDTKSYTFEILTNGAIEISKEIELTDFVKLKKEYLDFVNNAEMRATDSYIKITGVTKGKYTIKNLVLKVKGTDIQREFGTVTEDETYSTLKDLNFIDRVEKRLVSERKITLLLKGVPDKEINKNVKVDLNLAAKFSLE